MNDLTTEEKDIKSFNHFLIAYMDTVYAMLKSALVNKKYGEIEHLNQNIEKASIYQSTAKHCELSFCVTSAMYAECLVNFFFFCTLDIDVAEQDNKTCDGKQKKDAYFNC